MKTWIKRAGAVLLVAAGVVLLARHCLRLLDWKHLYPDLGQAGLGNLIFLALSLLTLAFAWIAAAYLVLNAGQRVLKLLIPAAAFILLMTLCGLCVTEAVGEVPCSYTSSLAACREELEPQSFRVRGKPLYPETLSGELTEYARYEKGAVLAETVTRSFDQDGFTAERDRLAALGLTGRTLYMDPRERPNTLYELRLGDTLWQVLLVPKTKTVTYSRFNQADKLPGFAPQPTEQPQGAGLKE
jgi:hypothetical protein